MKSSIYNKPRKQQRSSWLHLLHLWGKENGTPKLRTYRQRGERTSAYAFQPTWNR